MKHLFRFSIILLSLFACHRDKLDFVGPALVSAPEGFGVTSFTAAPLSVNFATGTVTFNAAFTHNVSWVLTITGQPSGAVHVLKGTSNGLTNIIWKGNHDEAIFFMPGDTAKATLSFYNSSVTSSLKVSITGVRNYISNGCAQSVFPRYGDFETAVKIGQPAWNPFKAAGAHQGVAGHNANGAGLDSLAIDRNGNPIPPVQGKNYYGIKGLGTQTSFVDGISNLSGTLGSFNTGSAIYNPATLPSNPDDVWVNIYLYGTGDVNAGVDIEYQESDFDKSHAGYQPAEDDAWVAHIPLTHTGWKLFSFQYSKLVPSSNAAFGGNGNKVHEPNRLQSFDVILLKKTNPNSAVEVYFDYPIITVGGPFEPCK
ncbi:MAG: hypothetical protein ACJ75J_10740 [Cytophagaceae bacterium]